MNQLTENYEKIDQITYNKKKEIENTKAHFKSINTGFVLT